ncbi:MAG: STAS domain-containing protein [Spirochaetota bacterium]
MEKTHRVSSTILNNIPVLILEGDITSEADSDIMNAYRELKEKHSPFYLIVDFNKTKYINSAGIATLINIIQDLGDFGGKVVFTGLSQHFHKVMDIVGITDFVNIYKTNEEALKNIETKA